MQHIEVTAYQRGLGLAREVLGHILPVNDAIRSVSLDLHAESFVVLLAPANDALRLYLITQSGVEADEALVVRTPVQRIGYKRPVLHPVLSDHRH